LHDAFFKHSKKSQQTGHGDLYYEGKEYEIKMKDYKPGRMSPALREALGIQENSPPPWLFNMQRYGPPPAYQNLKIPGVNTLIPQHETPGGFHGDYQSSLAKMFFTDDKGFTIYADCHGLNKAVYQRRQTKRPHWGELIKTDYEHYTTMQAASSSEDDEESYGQ
jgi:splicing factor 3B subunit 2